MTERLIFLGSGSAFTLGDGNWQSNMLLETAAGRRLLIDCGGDVRFSLGEKGLRAADLDAVYISHLHADHVGGLEWLAFSCRFGVPRRRPKLLVPAVLERPLWEQSLRAGLEHVGDGTADLDGYFDVHPVRDQFIWSSLPFLVRPVLHVPDMPAFGLEFPLNGRHVLLTTDSQFQPQALAAAFAAADLVFHDCETSSHRSGVHAHYGDLVTLPAEVKAKMWLYHYQAGPLPDAVADGFLGFVAKGQEFV